MNACIDNFINGNLTDAKEQASYYTGKQLYQVMVEEYGWTSAKASATVRYLKRPSQHTFQAACDAQ